MPGYIDNARRLALLAIVAFAAACTDGGTSPDSQDPVGGGNNGGQNGGQNGGGNNGGSGNQQVVASIEITGGGEDIVVGYMGFLQAKAKLADGTPIERSITWQVSDPTIVTIDVVGAMIGRKVGTVQVTASADGKSATREVKVVPRRATYLQTSGYQQIPLHRGDKGWFPVLVLDQYRQLIHDAPVTFSSLDPSIVEVQEGAFLPRRAGSTRVTAYADGLSASTTMTVAAETTYPMRKVNGEPLPHVIQKSVQQVPNGTITRELVVAEGSITFSNSVDAWTQRVVVEEWETSEMYGNVIRSKKATNVSTSAGGWILNANGNLRLSESGSSAEPLWGVWLDGARGVRVWKYQDAEGPAMSFDYHRNR